MLRDLVELLPWSAMRYFLCTYNNSGWIFCLVQQVKENWSRCNSSVLLLLFHLRIDHNNTAHLTS